MHKGKPLKQGLLRSQIAKAGLAVDEFLRLYKLGEDFRHKALSGCALSISGLCSSG